MDYKIYLVFKSCRRDSAPIKYANNTQLIRGTNNIYSWKSTWLSKEEIIIPHKLDANFSAKLAGSIIFKGVYLKQKCVSFLYKNIINLFISYKLDTWSKDLKRDFTIGNWLFGTVKQTKNADQVNTNVLATV